VFFLAAGSPDKLKISFFLNDQKVEILKAKVDKIDIKLLERV
jgi:hypothetical protein